MQTKTQRTLLLLRLSIQSAIALLLSLVITIINYGFAGDFIGNWVKGFLVAFAIIPLAMRLIPPVARGARAMLGNRSDFVIGCAVAICVAAMMEGLISLVITLAQSGFSANMLTVWGATFVKALPVGLLIGFTMTFFVQPRMQRLAAAGQASGALT